MAIKEFKFIVDWPDYKQDGRDIYEENLKELNDLLNRGYEIKSQFLSPEGNSVRYVHMLLHKKDETSGVYARSQAGYIIDVSSGKVD